MSCEIKYQGQSIPEEQFLQHLNKQIAINNLFEEDKTLANSVYEALGFKQKQYASKLKEISERRNLAARWDLENSQLIKDIRVDKSQPKALKPNAADINLASIMLFGHRYSDLSDMDYIDNNLSTITNPNEMQSEAEALAYRILNDLLFDIKEISEFYDEIKSNPEYANALTTNENPVKEFFENDIFDLADKKNLEITPEQKQQAIQVYSQYLNTIFPDSKVKDIVYHGSGNKDKILKEGFKNNSELYSPDDNRAYEQGELGYGYYFTSSRDSAKNYGEQLISVLLNNPDITNETTFNLITNEKGIQHFVRTKEQIHILGSQADIQGFKEFVNNINANITTISTPSIENPHLQNIFDLQLYREGINFNFKVVDNIIKNLSKVNNLVKKIGLNDQFWNKIQQDLQIPKEQVSLLKQSEGDTIEEKLSSFIANYSYTVEINTAKEKIKSLGINQEFGNSDGEYFTVNGVKYSYDPYSVKEERYSAGNRYIEQEEYEEAKLNADNIETPTQHYSNLTVPGGTNYTENAIRIPGVVNIISAGGGYHDNEFNQSRGDMAGWFRSDDLAQESGIENRGYWNPYTEEVEYDDEMWAKGSTKTRRILEVQSFFQKVRDKEDLVSKGKFEYKKENLFINFNEDTQKSEVVDSNMKVLASFDKSSDAEKFLKEFIPRDFKDSENQFLQLLNKNNNWVTFFIKSIIQDSAKKGYEKVLFPRLDTIIQIESQGRFKTYEEAEKFYKTPEWIKKNDKAKKALDNKRQELKDFKSKELSEIEKQYKQEYISKIEREIKELYENWHSLQPTLLNTAKFYENDVTNILDKQFKKNVSTITDEYGNTWNEVDLSNTNFNTSFSFDIDNNQSRQNITAQLKDKIYISEDLPYSVQQEVISSVAYLLLNNNPDTDISETNADKVKSDFEKRYDKAKSVLDKTNENSPAFEKINNLVEYYRISLENWDKVVSKSKEYLERIGFVSSEDSDYYDNLEEFVENTEESENVQFNDDSARTRNIIDFIPSEVKKLLYFIPAYRKLDPSVPSDKAIMDSKNTEYTPEGNSLGLPYFNDFNDTWTKTLTILSKKYFDSDRSTGWVKMLNTLLDKSNPIVVQELGRKLQSVPSKVQNAFYTSTNLQVQKNLTTKSELKDLKVDGDKSTQKTTRVIASDRNTGIRKISTQLKQEFNNSPDVDILIQGSNIKGNILSRAVDSVTGKVINVVNTNFGKVLRNKLTEILKQDSSYLNFTKANGEIKRSNYFTPEAQTDIYNLVLASGINISKEAFDDFLKTHKAENSEIISPKATVQSIFESRIFKTLSGESNRDAETDDTSKTDNDKNNPFVNDLSAINSLAYSEFKFRNNLQQGAFRQDGKSYYPFIRHHYLSEKFTNMIEKVERNEDKSEFYNILTTDNFASTSGILEDLIVNRLNNLELDYELGSKLTNSESGVKLLKDMNEREHQITKMAMYQNSGNKSAYFFYDTLSDKSTMPIIKRNRIEIEYDYINTSIDNGDIVLGDVTMNELYRYFEAEYRRIRKVEIENETLESDKKIKGYHKQGNKDGMGDKFLIYSFLNKAMLDVDNPDLSKLLYSPDGKLRSLNSTISNSVKQAINKHFNYIFQVNKEDMRNLRLFSNEDIYSLVDRNYLMKGKTNSIANKIGIVNNPKFKSFTKSFNPKKLGVEDTNRIIDYAIIDYVVNYALKTNEMLQLTGDPAQMGKLEKISYKEESDNGTKIRNKYKNLPNSDLLEAKDILQLHINSTLINVNKRNAAFLGSGSKGLFDTSDYNVSIANDLSINSNQLEEYKALFPGREDEIKDKYVKGDIADAQEVTTVKEHLNVMLAFAKLTPEQYRKGLYIYDRTEYNTTYPGQTENLTAEEKENLFKIIFQPAKPVQRIGVLNTELEATKHYYIKTSSFPIFPDLVKGTPMEDLLNDMKANKVDRIAFVSGVKLGVAGAKDLFDKDGQYNKNFFNNNINTLNRNGFRIQLEVPYKAGKNSIREGTQQAKILFVDIDDNINFKYQGKTVKGSQLKSDYVNNHRKIFELKRNELLEEINATYDGTYKFNNLKKLADLLQREAIDRGYGLNSILGLDLNSNGRFKIPLTFSPVAGKIEPVITAIISNRLAKMKLPGHSYIQGSEFILNTGRKGKIQSDEVLKDQRNIIWTDPKYANTTKLQYLRKEDGSIKGAQIVIAPYFVIGGQKLDINDFLIEKDGSKYLDTSRVDPSLLAMNGFRIPFQGHNSGMWFEIIGFLPQEVGDLAIVPGEIAAQMGSDYDVDKLYSYMYNYYYSGNKIVKISDSTTLKDINKNVYKNRKVVENEMDSKNISRDEALEVLGIDRSELKTVNETELEIMKLQNRLIDIHQAVYTNEELLTSILNPLSFDIVNQAIAETEEFSPTISSEFTGIYDPLYQRNFYFSNKGGKLGCLGYGTKVIMYDGSIKEVQDIKVGDQLMGPDSTPRNVLNLCRNQEQMYWVHQKRGISYRVNESHILSLKIRNFQNIKDEVCNIKLSDYLDTSISFQKNTYGYKARGIELSYKEVPLSPYYLGLWLGDGSKKSACAISNVDKEIREYLDNTYGIHRVEGLNNLTMFLKSDIINEGFKKAFNRTTSSLLPTENKYIPDLYLHNSKEVRLQLLAGLIDSDGTYCKKNKQYVIVTTDENFRDQICYLTRSLGFYTSWSLIKGITKKYPNGKTYTNKDYYNIRFIPECEIPVLLDRKKYQGKSEFKDRLVTSIFLERDIVDNYYGFELDGDHLFLLEDFTVTHNTAISALANTSHAQAQMTNLYIKGQGVVFEDAEGNIFKDEGKTNRTNKFEPEMYYYEDALGNSVDQNDGTQLSAWRLDKVFTFPDSKGRVYKISDLISQILGVSVDNAKEQVLSKFGINAQNFNTTLTIIRTGFDLATVKKFITQPILKEYYSILDSLTDMYTIDYTADKKNKAIIDLIDNYIQKYKLNFTANNFLNRPYISPANIGLMEDALRAGEVNESNVVEQLEILKAYLHYSAISDNLQALNRAYNMDSRGLPKNISDTLQKETDMINIFKSPYIGNINRYRSFSLPGVYGSLPMITNQLFSEGNNPLFAYNSTSYRNINKGILEVTGRETLYSNQQDIVNNNIKQFIYTSFLNRNYNLNDLKNNLLFDTETNKSLTTRFNELYAKYPKDKFLSSLDTVISIYPDNPKLIEIKMSSEDNYVQIISEAWEYAYTQNKDEDLKSFARDLFMYALAVSPQEFGSSSIIRYIPMTIMEETGFTGYLDQVHGSLNNEAVASRFATFIKQFLQHNPDFALSIRQEHILEFFKGTDDQQNIIKSFKLPPINSPNNKAGAIRRVDEYGNYYYPTYLSFYTNPTIGKQLYEKVETSEGTFYFLLPKLGVTNVTEYDINMMEQTSLFEENKVSKEVFIDSSAIINALRENNPSNQEDIESITVQKLFSQERTPETTINALQAITSRYMNHEDDFLRKIGTYYNLIATQLSKLDYSDVNIMFTQDNNSRTSFDGKQIFINTITANSNENKAGLNGELNSVRVILHELLHSAVFRKLNTSQEHYEMIEMVYDEYRTSIWSSKDKFRGVNKETFLGETLAVLMDNFRNNKDSNSTDLDINSISIPSNLTDDRLRSLLSKVSEKMKERARQRHIDANENLYDFSRDSDREQDFFNLIKDSFLNSHNFRAVINKFYPYISIQEFITESITNPQTQRHLKKIPGILERIRTVISDILKSIFGITSEERNLFQDAVDAVFNFITDEEIKQKEVSLPEANLDLGIETSASEDIDFTDPSIIQKILNLPCA